MREIDLLIVAFAFLLGSFFGYAISVPDCQPRANTSQPIQDIFPPMGQP